MPSKTPGTKDVAAFLAAHHGGQVTSLELLLGGYWSAAYAYVVDDRELVLRFGQHRDGFEMDRLAMAFDRPDLPVPEVYDVGEGLGGSFAISARHRGRFLETVRPDEAELVAPSLDRTLAALRAVPVALCAPAAWYPEGGTDRSTWQRWLLDGFADDSQGAVGRWRSLLAAEPDLDRLFRACGRRVGELVEVCPERRDLVHGDLLNRNVLVADDASRVTAVFSWKCSVRGDFLYDIAWCTFWGAWHPGIAALQLWDRTLTSSSLTEVELREASLRHHCYELQIGASHLGWNAWIGNAEELHAVAAHTEQVLERGPLGSVPRC